MIPHTIVREVISFNDVQGLNLKIIYPPSSNAVMQLLALMCQWEK